MVLDPLELDPTAVPITLPDHELQLALATLDNVYLACAYTDGLDDVADMLEFVTGDRFARMVTGQQEPRAAPASALAASLEAMRILRLEPLLSDAALVTRCPAAADLDRALLETLRRVALWDWLRVWLDEQPARWDQPPHDLYRDALVALAARPDADPGPHRELVAVALRDALSVAATMDYEILPADTITPVLRSVDQLVSVNYRLARAARRCGFVVFEHDLDGVMRRKRLFVSLDGRVIGQLAFAVAFDALQLDATRVRATPGQLVLAPPDRSEPIRIQLDEQGRMLVPWIAQRDWRRQFSPHVPIDALWQIHDRRLKIRQNQLLILEHLKATRNSGLLAESPYIDDLETHLRLEIDLRTARYRGDEEDIAYYQDLRDQVRVLLPDSAAALRAALPYLIAQAGDDLATRLREVELALATNDAFEAEITALLDRLRPRLRHKICLVGYTATALADMTPIATHPRAPGVIAHANLLNGLLTGQTVSWAPHWMNAALALAMGLIASYMSARWPPRVVALLALLGLGYLALAGWLAFYAWTFWIAVTPAVAALLLSYISIVIHRYLFLERESRQLARALGQYTSATLARQMAEDAELCKRAEMREVTAMFTDLAGFTTISEAIGAERTQHVLNVALGQFSDVLLQHEAMINKFIGDGIFAFWNPVIFPQDDHARRACEAALDLQTALTDLVQQQRTAQGDAAFAQLILRVGVASGRAVVGPCGSEQKYDYTCIGDSVNVAARLESANKFYGTRILVSGLTFEQAATDLVVRPLGGVQVKGKTEAVPILELLGRAGEVDDDTHAYADQFARAITTFQSRKFDAARRQFEQCLKQRPDDRAAQEYLTVTTAFLTTPPPDDWNGALELTEK